MTQRTIIKEYTISFTAVQWFSTFYARRTPKIIIGLHVPLNHKMNIKRCIYKGTSIHFYDLHGPLRPAMFNNIFFNDPVRHKLKI